MKELIQAYTNLSTEMRMGIIALVSLILIGIGIKCSMQYWVKPDVDTQKQAELAAAWDKAHSGGTKGKDEFLSDKQASTEYSPEAQTDFVLFKFDPNTIDSLDLIKLGVNAKATRNLLNWRRKGKHFYKPEDLKPLYNLSSNEFDRLAPYISIGQ